MPEVTIKATETECVIRIGNASVHIRDGEARAFAPGGVCVGGTTELSGLPAVIACAMMPLPGFTATPTNRRG